MKSYAAVDRIVGKHAVCEVELLETENSNSEDYYEHAVITVEIPIELILRTVEEPSESDIFVVEHENGCVTEVYGRSEEEKTRREVVYDSIVGS